MNIGTIKSSVGRCAFISKFSILILTLGLGLMPQHVFASSTNTQFQQFVTNLCAGVYGTSASWDTAKLILTCNAAQAIVTNGGTISANLGNANASSGLPSRKKKGIREAQSEQNEKTDKGASADGGRWGFLVTPQYGNSTRTETDLENGYQAKLKGLVAGLDYRFSDSFVLGATLGQTKDDATFLNSAGSLKTSNNTFNMYGTWIPSENASVDGYLGYGKINFDSDRRVEFGPISGLTVGSTSGQQIMAGMSTSYQKDIGRLNLSPFINLDYIKTSINSYSEAGNNPGADSIALRYGERSKISFTSSLGARVSSSYGYDWGTLQPSARLATVHEFQNNAKQLNNELVSTPGLSFSVATDAPDRNYLNFGLGLSAALNSGTQLFLDYDKRTQDKLLSSWAISLGVLTEF
jgi:uncharacterized protein YhjY with autotransporter beta-barrel domain